MTDSDPKNPNRFRLLATFVAGRSVAIALASAGQAAHTNGQVIFVSADRSVAEQRREIVIQSALLGAGSLDQRLVKPLRARPSVARRYLALEGRRVLAGLGWSLPLAAAAPPRREPEHRNRRRITRGGQRPGQGLRPTGVVRRHQALPATVGFGRGRRAAHRQRAASGIRPHGRARGRRRRRRRRAVRGEQDPQTV